MEWRDIPGFTGLYKVSSEGLVWSITSEKIKTPHLWKGYRVVSLSCEGRGCTVWVHTLVALAFLGPRPDNAVIRHINGNRLDNRKDNLRYGTQLENVMDNYHNGLYKSLPVTKRRRVTIRRLLKTGMRQVDIAKRLRVSAHLVHRESKSMYRAARAASNFE